jgi:hypothetical protein
MSDTPETDDQPIIYALNELQYQIMCVDSEFARKLERERDEAREKYDILATEHMLAINKLCNERDEAMALAYWVGNRPIATPCRDSCRDHEIEGWKNKWECAVEMAARAENTVDYLLGILADIRVAVGDKEGKLMQDELVEHCRMLKREYDSSY